MAVTRSHASLIVQGKDQAGIVVAVASVLTGYGANIVSLDQYSDDRAVQWHSEDRVIRDGNHTVVFA